MMLTPETYYELYIRGKNQEELFVIIKELKEEIIKLQNIIKQPDYLSLYKPDEKTMIACYKEYLDLAREEFLKNTVYELNINLDYTVTNKQKNLILNRMFLTIKELPKIQKVPTINFIFIMDFCYSHPFYEVMLFLRQQIRAFFVPLLENTK